MKQTSGEIIPFPDVDFWIMPKRLHLEEHLSTQELEERYRRARDPVERTHYQIVWLLSLGKLTREVAEATGYSPEWIREVSRRYNEGGAEGLGDRRHRNPGAAPLLSPEQQRELGEALEEPPEDGGMWNSAKVASCLLDPGEDRKAGARPARLGVPEEARLRPAGPPSGSRRGGRRRARGF